MRNCLPLILTMAPLRALLCAACLLCLYVYGPGQALPNMEAKICTICLPEGILERAVPAEVSCEVGLLRSKIVNVDVDIKGCFVLTNPDPSEPKSFRCSIEFSKPLVETPRISITRTFSYNVTDGSYTDKYAVEVCPLIAGPRFSRSPVSRHGFGGIKKPPTTLKHPKLPPVVTKAAPKLKHKLREFFGHIPKVP